MDGEKQQADPEVAAAATTMVVAPPQESSKDDQKNGLESLVSNDCVEITIPSLPELGINETRTVINPPNPSQSSSFILNYIVPKDP